MIDSLARQQVETDLESNFLVEASAGTGKTHSLASRIVRGIVRGAYPVSRVAAVTFTRKAAAELSGRIRLELEKAGAATALAQFDQLFVGTVHSFCGRLLRQFPVQAGVSPGFRELEEGEDRRLRRHFVRSGWEEPQGRSLLRLLAEFDMGASDLWSGLDCLVNHGEVDFPAESVGLPDFSSAWKVVDSFRDYLVAIMPRVDERQVTCKLLNLSQNLCRKIGQAHRDRLRDLIRLVTPWESEPTVVKLYWGSHKEERNRRVASVLEAVARFREQLVRPFLTRCRVHLYGECLPFLSRVRQLYQKERHKLALLNFNDLLCVCVRMLRENDSVRERLQEKFRHLFIDEFQDTDPIQAEIFFLLAGPGQHWLQVVPRPASLFLVGDPKQSIYRFRRADIQTYNAVRARILETGGKVVGLETSFRSRPALCEWVNRSFSNLLPPGPTAHQAHFAPLHSEQGEQAGAAVFQLTGAAPRYQEAPTEEAEVIASRIQAWVCQEKTHAWGDFLILTARKLEVRVYQRALQRLEIPCQAVCEEGPLGARAASFLPLLRHLADPQDKANLVGVLRGPMFGHSDEELFGHVQTAGSLRPHPVMSSPPSSVAASLAKLDKWRLAIRWMPLGAAAQLLLDETGLASLAAAEIPVRLAELRGIVQSLRSSGEAGLTLAQGVAELVERGAVELPATTCGSSDVVRVMNVHKAKGLEARVVFLASPTAGFSLTADHVLTSHGEGFVCLRKFRKACAHPAQWASLEAEEMTYLQAEQRRFLYVAATRARETLIVGVWGGSHGSVSRPWLDLHPFLQDCPEMPRAFADSPTISATPSTTPSEWQQLQEGRESRRTPGWTRGSAAVGRPSKPTLPPDHVKVDAQDWGRLIHRLLEALTRQPHLTREEFFRLGRWFCFDIPGLLEALPAALEALEHIKRSPLWDWLEDARDRLVEVPFGVKSRSRLLFGTIDLALRRDDGWGLIDHKTDRQRMDALVNSYARQVEQYAQSWSEVTEEPLRYSGLFGVREGQLSPDLTPPPR